MLPSPARRSCRHGDPGCLTPPASSCSRARCASATPTACSAPSHFRGKGALEVAPDAIVATLETLRGEGFGFLASVHGVDYYPHEPRLGVQYELLDMEGARPPDGEAARPASTRRTCPR